MNALSALLKQTWQLLKATLGVLFLPLQFLFAPFARFWPRRLLSRRARAWSSPSMGTSKNPLSEGLFKSDALNRAAPQTILRPVNALFVLFTLLVGLLLNLLPWGNWHWVPDWLALVLTFWACREPRLVGFGVAFIFGLFMDVHDGSVIGEHALGYVLLAYASVMLSRRLPSFDALSQALHIWPVFLIAQMLTLLVRVFFGGNFPGWVAALGAPTLTALIWPMASWLLLAPQRKPLDIDKNRPL
jgi:rod shape-determining protein MreD